MRMLVAISAALLVTSIGMVSAAADLESGLKVGEAAGAFNVRDVTGPAKGKTLCYR